MSLCLFCERCEVKTFIAITTISIVDLNAFIFGMFFGKRKRDGFFWALNDFYVFCGTRKLCSLNGNNILIFSTKRLLCLPSVLLINGSCASFYFLRFYEKHSNITRSYTRWFSKSSFGSKLHLKARLFAQQLLAAAKTLFLEFQIDICTKIIFVLPRNVLTIDLRDSSNTVFCKG